MLLWDTARSNVIDTLFCCYTTRVELLCTHADRQGVGISVTVCVCVRTVTDFAKDEPSGVKFFLGGSSASKAGNLTFL